MSQTQDATHTLNVWHIDPHDGTCHMKSSDLLMMLLMMMYKSNNKPIPRQPGIS